MQAISLEFRHESGALAANGSDVVMFLDGRWNNVSCVNAIWGKIATLRSSQSKYNKQHFVGYTRLGVDYRGDMPQIKMSDPECPSWVPRLPGSLF